MPDTLTTTTRYFLTYRGVRLPLTLASEVDAAATENRGTFFRAGYDGAGLLRKIEKVVYGDIELVHVYDYDAGGALRHAVVTQAGDDPQLLTFPT
jgi:hypothetical protein